MGGLRKGVARVGDVMQVQSARDDRAERGLTKIRRDLGPQICGFLEEPSVVEIMLNPDGALWVERQGEPMRRVGDMQDAAAEALIATVAAMMKTTVTRENPILECELPGDGSRFEALIPPIVARPSFTIRRKATRVFTLADYVAAGTMTEAQRQVIENSIVQRKNILVVGGTGTGKTTLTNAILDGMAALAAGDRIVTIEDTNELQCNAENVVPLRATDQVDMQRLLKATMRLRPDRIVVGEVRGKEALALLKAWNTGHPGGVATVHANDGLGGLLRLETLVAEGSLNPMPQTIAAAVNTVIVIAKTPNGRRITEVLQVHGWDGQNYLTSNINESGH